MLFQFLPKHQIKNKNYHCGIGAITDFIENSVDWFDFLFSVFVSQPSPEITQSLFVGRTLLLFWVQLL
jgi:hypothetical protein